MLYPNAFSDLKNEEAVLMALSRLQRTGMIRRLTQGLYQYPRTHPVLGTLPPQPDAVAKALSEKNNLKLLPSGAYAANLIGLIEQYQANYFSHEWPFKKNQDWKSEIIFAMFVSQRCTQQEQKLGLRIRGFLKNIGKNNVDEVARRRLQAFLKETPRKELENNLKYAPHWIRLILRALADEEPT